MTTTVLEDNLIPVSAKAHFPPDMSVAPTPAKAEPRKTRGRLIAAGLTTLLATAAWYGKNLDDASKGVGLVGKVVDLIKEQDQTASVEDTFNAKVDTLYAKTLTPALAGVTPSIRTIVAAASDPTRRSELIDMRQAHVNTRLMSKVDYKTAAFELVNEFDAAGACLNSGSCKATTWHMEFDSTFCQFQRSYGLFVANQRQLVWSYAQDFEKALATIDCTRALTAPPAAT
ncbi:hypothetical protein GCM10007880_63350 [Mesorhizobium amorphae]|uniref:hypothetical protein n=1 Tax=Mesorhizobium amorphae TaxID=71433 RepID=UPI00235C3C41|nr:hypothetical protein [Mesorhizobium amorphae]GLR45817.1 hypothetical protein GCM10007880_63350 [Mesorhizobium amorphae]